MFDIGSRLPTLSVILLKMAVQRTLRSSTSLNHSIGAMSSSQHEDYSSQEKNLVKWPAPNTLAKANRKRSRKPEGNAASPLAKIARIQTPEPHERALSKLSHNGAQVASHLPNNTSKSSLDRPAEPHRTVRTFGAILHPFWSKSESRDILRKQILLLLFPLPLLPLPHFSHNSTFLLRRNNADCRICVECPTTNTQRIQACPIWKGDCGRFSI